MFGSSLPESIGSETNSRRESRPGDFCRSNKLPGGIVRPAAAAERQEAHYCNVVDGTGASFHLMPNMPARLVRARVHVPCRAFFRGATRNVRGGMLAVMSIRCGAQRQKALLSPSREEIIDKEHY